ncbi:HlyD family secretion protein [Alteromonas sp. ASW11-130]|uniref:HlyD family secretion protein n=1 Tax=Alteromonas sp. ASW11-130 TaxID=3015775 RepID=UPI002241F488|nr:HlyD family efflux transporter periplasmic adaptor subunit [Alteromonas sp. ASW11-130]MCW8091916.1 HlyD family efflux transporter periplasmic adaptor subunit [Alteromonas sp. ASW11-130]
MRKGLFREQAIQSQRQQLDGNVVLLPQFSTVLITILVFAWIGIVTYFLITHDYAQHAQVNGWLEPSEGVIRIYPHRSGGRITTINVQEGQHVNAGQTLLTLDNRSTTVDGSLEQKLLEEYKAQKITLQSQLAMLENHYSAEQQTLNLSIHNTEQQLANIEAMKELVMERLALAQSHYTSARALAEKQLLPQQEVRQLRGSFLAVKQDASQMNAERLKLSSALEEKEASHKQLMVKFEQNTNDIKVSLSEINQRIATTISQQAEVIKAPKAGIVSNLHAFVGEYSQQQKPLLTLLPNDSVINAKLIIPVRSAGFVKAGQSIDLRYDAFPYQKFGVYSGKVTDIAQSVSLPGELHTVPVTFDEPAYVVNATIDSNNIRAYGMTVPLKAGMTFSAHIEVSKRSLIEWLFEPLYSLAGRV